MCIRDSLRNGDLSSHDASVTTGPTGILDAFSLERELNMSTFGLEWELIGAEFTSQFGLYTVFNASEYEGSIISISSESGFMFDVSLRRSKNSTQDYLSVTLPRLKTLRIYIPESVNLRSSSSFQSIGLRLKHYHLLVIVNCTVVNFIDLPQPSQPLPVADGVVQVFGDEAIVSNSLTTEIKNFKVPNSIDSQ